MSALGLLVKKETTYAAGRHAQPGRAATAVPLLERSPVIRVRCFP